MVDWWKMVWGAKILLILLSHMEEWFERDNKKTHFKLSHKESWLLIIVSHKSKNHLLHHNDFSIHSLIIHSACTEFTLTVKTKELDSTVTYLYYCLSNRGAGLELEISTIQPKYLGGHILKTPRGRGLQSHRLFLPLWMYTLDTIHNNHIL